MPLNPFLCLVPLAPVDLQILPLLRRALADFLAVQVGIVPARPLPPHTYNQARNQYHSTQLLEYLLNEDHGAKPLRLLGITAADLYIPIFTFVFGEAQLDGQAAIVSTFRPGGDAGGVKPPPDLLLNRLIKLSLHELGHTFGLPHCRQDGCLMGFAANLEKLDQKKIGLCRYCLILLDDYFNALEAL